MLETGNKAVIIPITAFFEQKDPENPIYEKGNWKIVSGVLPALMSLVEHKNIEYVIITDNMPFYAHKVTSKTKYHIWLSYALNVITQAFYTQPTQKVKPQIVYFTIDKQDKEWEYPSLNCIKYLNYYFDLDQKETTFITKSYAWTDLVEDLKTSTYLSVESLIDNGRNGIYNKN